jgi:FKBP-type peptidyl-prolyl cis-trans isomerase FkpA
MFRRSAVLTLASALAVGCAGEGDGARDTEEATTPPAATEEASMSAMGGPPPITGDTVTTESGLQYIIFQAGEGAAAQAGQQVLVHYTGWLTDGSKFDSSVDRGEPYAFPLGAGYVIRGWDEGVAGMLVGEQRRLIIPHELAYGESGRGSIPPRATLIFDVELMGIAE